MPQSNYLILVGPPNSGKTTLFNWITGYKRNTVNYPGSTVNLSFGVIQKKVADCPWKIIDTPGLYDLSDSLEEGKTSISILQDSIRRKELRGIILVLDSTRLERHLSLALQLKSMKLPFVIALSMYDLQKKAGGVKLSLLSKKMGVPVVPIEGLLGGGVRELLKESKKKFQNLVDILDFPVKSWSAKAQEKNLKATKQIGAMVSSSQQERKSIHRETHSIDAWLLHPIFGFGFLSLILFVFFSSIFWLAQPLMDSLDSLFSWSVEKIMSIDPNHLLLDFLANGLLTSFGSFFVFVPQVFILFIGIYLLEDSGYLARAVTLVDGPFSYIGLSGKALFPFLSGFACAIPAVLSARSISSKRQRWITIFVLPLMTCSARLPVYALLLSFLFYGDSAWKPGLMMSLLYFLSLFLGLGLAGILNLFLKSEKTPFSMELPLYRRPVLSNILSSSWSRTRHFIKKAGPVIFLFALIMWGLTHFPRSSSIETNEKNQIKNSYAGQIGQAIEPVFEKMGGDWRTGVSLVSAFVAREVFVSILAVTLKNTQTNKEQSQSKQEGAEYSLVKQMRVAQMSNGENLFSTASVIALIVFFMLSLQCLSTTGITYKETRAWPLAVTQLISFNVLAYVGSVLVYQLLS